MFETKAIEVAVGQITGYIKPSEAERKAAYELFVELSTRTATVSVDDERPSVRATLKDLAEVSQLTRDILRNNGADSAKDRADGNVSLAVIALRVVNEIIGPRLSKWQPLLDQHMAERDGDTSTALDWENEWGEREVCLSSIATMRVEVRSYMDTLARIAGAASLSDLVEPPPASAPIPSMMLTTAPDGVEGAQPRTSMVRWFDIGEGIRTLAAKRRSGASKRKPAAGAETKQLADYGLSLQHTTDDKGTQDEKDDELWIDYVSDLGDGLDPTIAVAWQLTQAELTLPKDRSGLLPDAPAGLPRGSLLVMGGDQVYPYASKAGYENQLILPYRLAASANVPPTSSPKLLAIPGDHDWFGGIEHFQDVFIKGEEFAGCWDTSKQKQRWWAVHLRPGWWMWGMDTGLDHTLDRDQIEYFERASEHLSGDDQVIVCTPVPMWQLRQKRQDRYFELRAFLQKTIQERGARTPLFLAGDSHFFAHYRRVDGAADEHHVTAGGGGAFLQPTHNLAEQVPFETGAPDFKLGSRWPRPVDSRTLGANVGGISDRQFRLIFVLLGALLASFGALASIGNFAGSVDSDARFVDRLRWVASGWPGWPILLVVVLAAMKATTPNSKEPGLRKGAKRYGLMHGAAQAALFVLVTVGARSVISGTNVWWHFLVAPLLGGVLSAALMVAAVRWINRRIKASDTLAYSSAHVTRYKHFVRMRIDRHGDLTVFVVGLDPVGKDWWKAIKGATDEGARQDHRWRNRRAGRRTATPAWRRESLLPPFDPAGVPQMHYVWGRTFAAGSEVELAERERVLGPDHPDTIFSRGKLAQKLLENGDVEPAVTHFRRNVRSCRRTYTEYHETTATYRDAYADALMVQGYRGTEASKTIIRQLERVLQTRNHIHAEPRSSEGDRLVARAQLRLARAYWDAGPQEPEGEGHEAVETLTTAVFAELGEDEAGDTHAEAAMAIATALEVSEPHSDEALLARSMLCKLRSMRSKARGAESADAAGTIEMLDALIKECAPIPTTISHIVTAEALRFRIAESIAQSNDNVGISLVVSTISGHLDALAAPIAAQLCPTDVELESIDARAMRAFRHVTELRSDLAEWCKKSGRNLEALRFRRSIEKDTLLYEPTCSTDAITARRERASAELFAAIAADGADSGAEDPIEAALALYRSILQACDESAAKPDEVFEVRTEFINQLMGMSEARYQDEAIEYIEQLDELQLTTEWRATLIDALWRNMRYAKLQPLVKQGHEDSEGVVQLLVGVDLELIHERLTRDEPELGYITPDVEQALGASHAYEDHPKISWDLVDTARERLASLRLNQGDIERARPLLATLVADREANEKAIPNEDVARATFMTESDDLTRKFSAAGVDERPGLREELVRHLAVDDTTTVALVRQHFVEGTRVADVFESEGHPEWALEQHESMLANIPEGDGHGEDTEERFSRFRQAERFHVARLSVQCGDPDRALELLETLRSKLSDPLPPVVDLVGFTSRRVVDDPVPTPEFQRQLANAYLQAGRLDEAREICAEATSAAASSLPLSDPVRRNLRALTGQIEARSEAIK